MIKAFRCGFYYNHSPAAFCGVFCCHFPDPQFQIPDAIESSPLLFILAKRLWPCSRIKGDGAGSWYMVPGVLNLLKEVVFPVLQIFQCVGLCQYLCILAACLFGQLFNLALRRLGRKNLQSLAHKFRSQKGTRINCKPTWRTAIKHFKVGPNWIMVSCVNTNRS